jgi:hypothetical protein
MNKKATMKKLKRTVPVVATIFCLLAGSPVSKAGNPDRAGEAGATELLINPWARSSGQNGANSGSVQGLEALFMNVAGIAGVKKTEFIFSHTQFLKGAEIGINAFGFAHKLGETGSMAVALTSFDFGKIQRTTVDLPEGGIGTFSPQYLNLTLAYSKIFSNSIYGGLAIKVIDEHIENAGARGIALDAGIQYTTGNNADRNNIKFGIALKNVGSQLQYNGDGLSTRMQVTPGGITPYEMAVEQRTNGFEIPSLVNIGFTYDILLAKDHRLSPSFNYTSNSFTNDQFILGAEYAFMNKFMLRAGYAYEDNITNNLKTLTAYTGLAAGFSLDLPLGKGGKLFSIDYSYRATYYFDGTHSMGVKFTL